MCYWKLYFMYHSRMSFFEIYLVNKSVHKLLVKDFDNVDSVTMKRKAVVSEMILIY